MRTMKNLYKVFVAAIVLTVTMTFIFSSLFKTKSDIPTYNFVWSPDCDPISQTGVKNLNALIYQERLKERHDHIKKVRNDARMWEIWSNTNRAWSIYEPIYNCPDKEKVGGLDDGGKYVCGIRRIKSPCLVYSFGGSFSDSFEHEVQKLTGCEIHIFDPTPGVAEVMAPKQPPGITYHALGLSGSDGFVTISNKQVPAKKLSSIMQQLGHVGRKIEILKVDIEWSEWDSFNTLFSEGFPDVGQIQIELHWRDLNTLMNFMQKMEDNGFVMFSKDPNLLCGTICYEFSFIKMDPQDLLPSPL